MKTEPVTITITATGPQGCGKTVLLRALEALLHDSAHELGGDRHLPKKFRLLQSDGSANDHTITLKGFQV